VSVGKCPRVWPASILSSDESLERIQSEYHANQRAIVERLADRGDLRSDLDVETATDILWTINHPNTWQLLVVDQGWTPDEYEQWTADTACAQLLQSKNDRRGTRKRE
jgi:hypothetical protein